MDLIHRAQEKRDWHRAELSRLEAFLATAFELEQDFRSQPPVAADARTDAQKADLPVARVSRQRGGVGADTLMAAKSIIRERGPMSTRDLLPLVRAKGIEVGGNDAVATLSARISNKGPLVTYNGKWQFKEVSEPNGSGQKETAENPATDQSAVSLFNPNHGAADAAALVE